MKTWRVAFPVTVYMDIDAETEPKAAKRAYQVMFEEVGQQGYIAASQAPVVIDAIYPKFDHEAGRLVGASVTLAPKE